MFSPQGPLGFDGSPTLIAVRLGPNDLANNPRIDTPPIAHRVDDQQTTATPSEVLDLGRLTSAAKVGHTTVDIDLTSP
jgi:hypothetical protein